MGFIYVIVTEPLSGEFLPFATKSPGVSANQLNNLGRMKGWAAMPYWVIKLGHYGLDQLFIKFCIKLNRAFIIDVTILWMTPIYINYVIIYVIL